MPGSPALAVCPAVAAGCVAARSESGHELASGTCAPVNGTVSGAQAYGEAVGSGRRTCRGGHGHVS
ncbi:hypothetical protein ACWGDE_07140 [Streptomyces sp. NPDC054956]